MYNPDLCHEILTKNMIPKLTYNKEADTDKILITDNSGGGTISYDECAKLGWK